MLVGSQGGRHYYHQQDHTCKPSPTTLPTSSARRRAESKHLICRVCCGRLLRRHRDIFSGSYRCQPPSFTSSSCTMYVSRQSPTLPRSFNLKAGCRRGAGSEPVLLLPAASTNTAGGTRLQLQWSPMQRWSMALAVLTAHWNEPTALFSAAPLALPALPLASLFVLCVSVWPRISEWAARFCLGRRRSVAAEASGLFLAHPCPPHRHQLGQYILTSKCRFV